MANDSMRELMLKIGADVADLKGKMASAKQELSAFQQHAEAVGGQIKGALAFAGIAVGLGLLVEKIKSMTVEWANIGARTETVQVAMQAVGKNAGLSAQSLDYFTAKVKGAGITTQESMTAITKFMMQGLPLDRLQELATRARDLAVIAGKNTSETLAGVVHGIVTQQTEVLRTYGVNVGTFEGIFDRYAESIGKTRKELNSVEKAQAALSAVLEATGKAAGAAAAADETVGKQLQSLQRYAITAKEAMWDMFQPAYLQIIKEVTSYWKELTTWAQNNKDTLREWGDYFKEWVTSVAAAIKSTVQWAAANRELLVTIVELAVVYKLAGWLTALGTAVWGCVTAVKALATGAATAQMAFGGWLGVLIKIVAALAVIGMYKAGKMAEKEPGVAAGMMLGDAWTPEGAAQIDDAMLKKPKEAPPGWTGKTSKPGQYANLQERIEGYAKVLFKDLPPEEARKKAADMIQEQAELEAKAAVEKAIKDAPKPAGKKEGKGKKETDYTGYLMGEINAQKKLELEQAQESLENFKSLQAARKDVLDDELNREKISGEAYWKAVGQMEQDALARSKTLVQQKIDAENNAYEQGKAVLEGSNRDPVRKSADLQKLELDHQTKLLALKREENKLDADHTKFQAERTKAAGEMLKTVNDSLRDNALGTALGPVEEREERINKLVTDQLEKRREMVRLMGQLVAAGEMSPEDMAGKLKTFDQQNETKLFNEKFGADIKAAAQAITQGFTDMIDSMMEGGQNFMQSAHNMFKQLFSLGMKPGLEALQQQLIGGFKSLFGAAGSALASAVMGVIGLVGMLLTSGSQKSSWSPSGVQSGVTASEPVRGVIAGETSIPIAQISDSLRDATAPHLSVLRQIETNTRGGGKGGGGGKLDISVTVSGIMEQIDEAVKKYFKEYLIMGAGA